MKSCSTLADKHKKLTLYDSAAVWASLTLVIVSKLFSFLWEEMLLCRDAGMSSGGAPPSGRTCELQHIALMKVQSICCSLEFGILLDGVFLRLKREEEDWQQMLADACCASWFWFSSVWTIIISFCFVSLQACHGCVGSKCDCSGEKGAKVGNTTHPQLYDVQYELHCHTVYTAV